MTTPGGLVIKDLLKSGAFTPPLSSAMEGTIEDDAQTVTSVNTSVGLSKENTVLSEQPITPR